MAEDMLKLPTGPSKPDTIIRNLRRITSTWNLMVFIVNPAFSWFIYVYLCLHLAQDSILPPRAQALVGLIYLLFSCGLMYATSDGIKSRLQKAGYTHRKTRGRVLGLLLNFVGCVACFFWVQSWDEWSEFWNHVHIVVGALSLWYGLVLAMLGPTLWFTVPVEDEE